MTLYDTTVDTSVVNSSHSIVVRLVGEDRRVLDVGCSTGYVARALTAAGCTVSGIEYNPQAAELARPTLERLVVADLNQVALDEAFSGESFDSIVMADVLEHLEDPVGILRAATNVLAPDGSIVISIPNVAHGSLRLALLQGRWRYRDTGLLDRTHIHFYTVESLHEILAEAGLVATEIQSVVLDPLAVEVEIDEEALPEGVSDWVRAQPEAHAYQYVLTATRAVEENRQSVVPVPAVPVMGAEESATRVILASKKAARNAEIVEGVEDLRHKVLVARDNAIGLETAASRARTEAVRLRKEADKLHRELAETRADVIETHARLRAALDETEAIRASRTWKLAQALMAPAHRLRGGAR